MIEEAQAQRDRIVTAILPHVAFEGWTGPALRAGFADAGLTPEQGWLAFPEGAPDAVAHWSAWADRQMLERLQEADLNALRIRDRIGTAVRCRLEVLADYREAVRRTLSWFALPSNAPLAVRCTYRTVDAIWFACGDKATDLSFYTKRATLAAVYGTTVLYWLDDTSEDSLETWAFLQRRIEDAMRIPRLRSGIDRLLNDVLHPLRLRRGYPGL
jgi:ubiquinone biosynthesis protein COQ9